MDAEGLKEGIGCVPMDGSYHVECEGWNKSMAREIDSVDRRRDGDRHGSMPMEDRLRADGWNVSMKQQDRYEEEGSVCRIANELMKKKKTDAAVTSVG